MKILVSVIALAFAMPAVAQTAPAQPQHQDHSQQQQGGAANAPQADHSGHQMPAGKPHDGQHDQHAMKDGCCADKDGNGKMDCCEKMAAKTKPDRQPPAHEKH